MKIIASVWFTQKQFPYTIGIVFIENPEGAKKAYIGTASGHDQEDDELLIAQAGSPIYLSHADIIIEHLKSNGDGKKDGAPKIK